MPPTTEQPNQAFGKIRVVLDDQDTQPGSVSHCPSGRPIRSYPRTPHCSTLHKPFIMMNQQKMLWPTRGGCWADLVREVAVVARPGTKKWKYRFQQLL